MAEDHGSGAWRRKDGRDWRIGTGAETRWIQENTSAGVRVTCAIPAVFEAYATLELAGSGHGQILDFEVSETHDMAVVAILEAQIPPQPWWLGYLQAGGAEVVFDDVTRVQVHSWPYVLVEAGPEQARAWRGEDWKGFLPDLIFPTDHSWLFSTLWDDDWSYIGGSRGLIDAFLADPEVGGRVREVDPSMEDATPPGHIAF
jgi:hypothetical protein